MIRVGQRHFIRATQTVKLIERDAKLRAQYDIKI
jgi:hypothetical protein